MDTNQAVAPFAGAWIEIFNTAQQYLENIVAPFAGAWIEIPYMASDSVFFTVAPFAGAWIEIPICVSFQISRSSLPLRERGLKLLSC